MDVRIVTPAPQDARAITELLYKAWLVTYPNDALGITMDDIENSYKDAFSDDSIKKFEAKLSNIPINQKRVVAKDGDTIVGMATMVKNDTNNQLRMIYVLPAYHGKGIGTMLWNSVKDCVDPAKETIVQVADYNSQAIRFYEKLGFVDTGKRWKDDKWKMKSGAYIPEMEMILASQRV